MQMSELQAKSNNNLALCPFCGGEAEMLTAESMNGGYLFGIMCNDCRSRGDVYDTEAEAIAAWNSRAERTCHWEYPQSVNGMAEKRGGGMSDEKNEYLLEHFRRCGEFKCTECLYSLCEETRLGKMYDCKYPGTLRHKFLKDQGQVMHSPACCWFEPMARAGERVAERNAKQRETWRKVLDYAWAHTHVTERHDTIDEKRLIALQKELSDLGVMGV